MTDGSSSTPQGGKLPLVKLCIAALGVVYGDIGTSPLYALRECFNPAHGLLPSRENVLGVLSLVFWSLMVVVSLKYLQYVMRADDNGEGGILALMALASRSTGLGRIGLVAALGMLGAGLLFGDGIITPAISVLSAIEGLEIATPAFSRLVVPLTLCVLVGLFWVQRRGTGKVGIVFGPIIILWFAVLATLGTVEVIDNPAVLVALNPLWATHFLSGNHGAGFVALGAVFLVVTGGEALYADMGHFGRRPIRLTWFGFVLPALLLNYFGQGALVLRDPAAIDHAFYALAPRSLLVPLIVLATAATIIASQAVISGVFSLTRQATMLGFWPRVKIEHTSPLLVGQIYVPSANAGMMAATLLVVLAFKSSSNLAAAYGIAVTTTMVITTVLASVVARRLWGWSLFGTSLLTAGLLVVDLAFFGANLVKIAQGGWVPLGIAAFVLLLMTSWKYGRDLLAVRARENLVPLQDFYELLRVERPARVPGTAVFMTSNPFGTPPALLFNFMHNHVVHERVVLLTISTLQLARVPFAERVTVEELAEGFVRIQGRYGFMESPDVPELLLRANLPGVSPEYTTFFLGREAVVPEHYRKRSLRLRVFGALARNSASATRFFNLPPDRIMEIGAQLQV